MTSQQQVEGESSREHPTVRRLRQFGNSLLGLGGVFSCVLMGALFVVGFLVIWTSLWSARSAWLGLPLSADRSGSLTTDLPHTIVGVLHGLEFFFLAPLPALVFLSLAGYFKRFQQMSRGPDDGGESASLHQLHRVKALIVNLMIASLATDLLGKVTQGIAVQAILAESLVVLLLGVYWMCLERLSAAGASDSP